MTVSFEEFADRAALLEAVVQNSQDALLTKDLNSIVTSWNPAAQRMFGYEPSEIVGKSILMLIPDELQYEEPEILRKLRAGERIEHFETVRVAKDGHRVHVSLTISPLKNAEGKVVGASKMMRDISERKRMHDSLLQAEKLAAAGRMAATIAHEINNPLEGLVNLVYLAKTSPDVPVDVVQFLTAAEEELQRISHIAKQTLGFYREHTSPTPVSVSTLVQDVLAVYEPRLKVQQILLTTEMANLPKLMAKRGELSQVVSNLVVNAIHAMPLGGALRVTLVEASETCEQSKVDGVALTIEDSGTGIEPENIQRIFEPFFTTRGEIGTGIGLWVAKQFVEGHMGQLSVSSEVGKGTTMWIFLPRENGYGTGKTVQQ